MALFHMAKVTPTKAEAIASWIPTQPWGPPADEPLEVIGSFRFDDPEGQVGLETFLVRAGGTVFQVPLTYRNAPLADAPDGSLICEMEHTALGTRWVYDGLRDPRFVLMLAAVAMTGQGEALGLAEFDGRWFIAPTNVRISGGGWGQERVPVDGFEADGEAAGSRSPTLSNDRFVLTLHRRPVEGARPPIGLTATWDGGPASLVLAEVRSR